MDRRIASLMDVDVYQIARSLARDVDRQVRETKGSGAGNADPLGKISVLAQSVCRYIAEEFEAQKSGVRSDFGGFFLRAKADCGEITVWIACARAQGILSADRADSWTRICSRLSGMLEALYTHTSPKAAVAA